MTRKLFIQDDKILLIAPPQASNQTMAFAGGMLVAGVVVGM